MSHNIWHFAPLAEACFFQGVPHVGIIVARQFEKGELLRRTLVLLETLTSATLANMLRFI